MLASCVVHPETGSYRRNFPVRAQRLLTIAPLGYELHLPAILALAFTRSISVSSQVRGIFRHSMDVHRSSTRVQARFAHKWLTSISREVAADGLGHRTSRRAGYHFHGQLPRPGRTQRSAGSISTRREALRAANREEQKVLAGSWHDSSLGDITFRDYVETEWLPNKHVEASTRAAYASNLNKHFYPFFGDRRLNRISPTLVQDWVTQAHADGLSPRSIRKYHVLLVLDLRPRRQGPGAGLQPVRPHRAAQGDHPQGPHPHPRRVRPPPGCTPRAAPADGRRP